MKAREWELQFAGLYRMPLVKARSDGELKHENEVVHVIEYSAYQKALDALREIAKADCPNYMAHPQSVWWKEHVQSIAEKTLKEIEG